MRMLIVDDERVSRAKLGVILKDIGECAFAVNGQEALSLACAKPQPDLILLDVMMPGMDGYNVCKKLKDTPSTCHIPIIFITGRTDQESETRALQCGANDFIAKPFFPEIVKARVTTQLQIKKYRDSLEELVDARTQKLQIAYRQLEESQEKLLHQEKLSTIGQLAAGVLHEINSPLSYINGNLSFLAKHFAKIETYIQTISQVISKDAEQEMHELYDKLKMKMILENAKEAIESSKEGAVRIMKIATGLRNFSRRDQESDRCLTDINQCIEESLIFAANELKYKAEVKKDFGKLELLKCSPLQMSQVFINLLVNAAHAIEKSGVISIATRQENNSIKISITDTGSGISEENQKKIFEPFFTTKEAGAGTGLGMGIVSEIIKKHGGELSLGSEVGMGTTFTIHFPFSSPIKWSPIDTAVFLKICPDE